MTIGRGKLAALGAIALLAGLFAYRGFDRFAWGLIDYQRVQTITDEASAMHIALGRELSFSSDGYVLHVTADDDPPWPTREEDVIAYALHVKGDPTLEYSDGCYSMTVPHETSNVLRDKWKSPKTGHELCFELKGQIEK